MADDEEVLVEPEQTPEETVTPAAVNCRHCGAPHDLEPGADPDWQCPECERWQDTIACPTCHQPARISLLPKEAVPAAHAPKRR